MIILINHNMVLGYDYSNQKRSWRTSFDRHVAQCAVRWSPQPPEQPHIMSSEQYYWMLVGDFVANINEYRVLMCGLETI